MMGLGIYTLLPFLLISQYNQPSADDFYFAVSNSGNDLWDIQKNIYASWSGRFFSTIISGINPMFYHSFILYKIYSVILIILFTVTLTLLIREYLKNAASTKQITAISSVIIFLYFAQMPSTAEGFYWFSGYCAYQAANIHTMILLILVQKISPYSFSFKNIAWVLFSSVLCVAIIGSNEVSLIIVSCLIFFICLYHTFKIKKSSFIFLFLMIVCLVAGAVAILAPGNFERMKNVQEFSGSPLWTITGAISLSAGYFIKWALPLVIASLVYIPLFGIPLAKKINPGGNFFLVNLKLSIILYFLLFLLLELFFVWVAGGSNLGRVENVIYLYFLLGWFFNLNVIIVKYWKKDDILSTPLRNIIYGFICLLFFLNIFDINNNISTAYIDLISGKAKKYENELIDRQKLIKLSTSDTCIVKPLTEIPKTIFFTDIMSIADTAEFWNNEGYAKYFGKSFVITESKAPPIKSNAQTLEELGKQIRRKIFDGEK
jgi:hypothetical protein